MKVRMLSELEIGTRFQYQEHGPFHELAGPFDSAAFLLLYQVHASFFYFSVVSVLG